MKQIAPNTMVQSRYLVVQPIGKGGMGEVYLAVDQRLGSAVALKRTKFDADSPLAGAFEREARILARLRHPVLPKVSDHFADPDGQFLVMEHISGDDLDKRLSTANKPFPVSWVMFWADQLLDALNYLHSHNPPIIHRDIKPQNLKLTDDNHIILLDFGLSKDFETGSKEAPAAGSVVGYSPHFASMEQVRGTGTDARSDLYSLSATLYQLLSNTVPPDSLTRAEAILGGENDPLPPLSVINPEVTKAISDVILMGMSVRQDQRWASAAEMQKALRRAFNAPKDQPEEPKITEMKTMIMDRPVITDSYSEPIAPSTDSLPRAKTEPLPEAASMPTVDRIHTSAAPADATMRMTNPGGTREDPAKTAVMPAIANQTEANAAPQQTEAQPPVAMAAAAGAAASPQQPVAASTPAKKGSKLPLVIGALLGLGLLAGAAGGGGWYYYNNVYKASVAATPSPTPAVAPTPIPTINVVDASTPQTISTPEPSVEVPSTQATPEREVTTTGTSSKPAPGTVAKSAPSAKPPAAKATPKPKGDDRTVIMQ